MRSRRSTRLLQRTDVAVVQIELIQGVGGVRRVPERGRSPSRRGPGEARLLLLIDEVQTGMYRTGPFTLSAALGIDARFARHRQGNFRHDVPVCLDAVFGRDKRPPRPGRPGVGCRDRPPLSLSLRVQDRTQCAALGRSKRSLPEQVAESGALFAKLLHEELASCKAVREVRVFGLLIGIELDASRWPQRWFKKRLFWFYLAAMLRHRSFPVLVGFCQAEPNVLKITPPLTIAPDEIRQMCASIGEMLRRPFYRLLVSVLGGMLGPFRWGKNKRERTLTAADAAAGR